ncbi:MAG: fibrobacter succinogenes major paralogous domain-containing protein [Bacteroidia bacterium]
MKKRILVLCCITLAASVFVYGCKAKTVAAQPQQPKVITNSTTVTTNSTTVTTNTANTVVDVDGNIYKTVEIGGRVWMVENLRTTKYNDGTPITTNLDDKIWTSTTTGAYALYSNNAANNATYGKLYNWFAVNTGKLAPKGWHVPSRSEWTALVESLGGSSVAGGKLKSTSSLWTAPNVGATNSSGFNALPGGYRSPTGGFSTQGNTGFWWASSERNSTQGDYIKLHSGHDDSFANGATKQFGYSIRCVKD